VWTLYGRCEDVVQQRSKRPHSVATTSLRRAVKHAVLKPSRGVLSMFKIKATAWRTRRLHSVFTAFPQRCWRLHSAHLGEVQLFKRCGNAVRTPLWCDRASTQLSRVELHIYERRLARLKAAVWCAKYEPNRR